MQNSSWYSDRNLNLQVHCDNLKECIVHYSVNNGPQQNLPMPRNPQNNSEFNFAIANINSDTPVTYSFTTISQEGVGADTSVYNFGLNTVPNVPNSSSAFNEDEWIEVFRDDFDKPEINRSIWNVIESDFNGNNEEQYYKDCTSTVRVENSCLILQANKEDYKGKNYVSGKVTTENLIDFKYGRFEARIKMPNGCACWSAAWALPSISGYIWPEKHPEVDIVECIGRTLNTAAGSVNYGTTNDHRYVSRIYKFPQGTDASTQFVTYGVNIQPNKLTYYINNQIYGEINSEDISPYFDVNCPYYFILNLAVGGTLPGISADQQFYSQKMLIDWVRVLEKKF